MSIFSNHSKSYATAAAMILAATAPAFAISKTVEVTMAGTLNTLISTSEKNEITSLTVSGTLNGSDILFIREMAGVNLSGEPTNGKLTELNMADVALTDGGDAYYEDPWSRYYTATSYDVSESEDEYYCTDLSYAFTGSNLTSVVWPSTMWEVGEGALSYCFDLKKFALGSETNEIKSHAFYRCTSLDSFTFTPKIIYIDDFAFSNCTSLKSAALPDGVEKVDKSCFSGCTSLASVTLGSDVSEICEMAFNGCTALTSVELPSSLKTIGNSAFDGCTSLTEITLPKKLKTLGSAVFEGCTALNAIKVAEGNTAFASAEGVLFNKALTKLLVCPTGKAGAYAVPEGTEEIAASAFSRCSALTSVSMPETLTTIGEQAFYRCAGITELTLPNSVTSVGGYFVYRCPNLKRVTLGTGLSEVSECMLYNATGLESISIPEGYTAIKYEAIAGCSNLKSVSLPSTISSIDSKAFSGNSALESFTIKAATPVTITADVFEDVDQSACALYVPEASVAAYKADEQWGKFKNISGIVPTGISSPTAGSLSVSEAGGVLTVTGAQGSIEVYTLTGVRVASGVNDLSVKLAGGVYVVNAGGKATKAIVR